MDLDNIFYENTEEDEGLTQQGATSSGRFTRLFWTPRHILKYSFGLFWTPLHILKYIFGASYSAFFADASKTEEGISPVTGLVRGGGRRGPDIDWREIARSFFHLKD